MIKLSEMMRYMLYECNERRVPLNKEVNYIQNYLDLEKLRQAGNADITLKVEGHITDQTIAPLIFIPFLENSFKHGARNIVHKIHISISLKVEQGFLYFMVKNPVADHPSAKDHTGIGLKNAARRLELLYGNNYSLDTLVKDNTYITSLKIPVW